MVSVYLVADAPVVSAEGSDRIFLSLRSAEEA